MTVAKGKGDIVLLHLVVLSHHTHQAKTLVRGHASGHVNGILVDGDGKLVRVREVGVWIYLAMVAGDTDLEVGVGTVMRLPKGDAP